MRNKKVDKTKHVQYRQSLGEQVNNIEQEARMILPGIQALFGFQLVAVFNRRFAETLSSGEQSIHLAALVLVALSVILILAPAAYHRQANHHISEHFVELSSRFLAWAMVPFALGTCLDIYLVSKVISNSINTSLVIAGVISFVYLWVWFIFPIWKAHQMKNAPVRNMEDQK